MTDLEYTIRAICRRRGVALSKIESVAFNIIVTFGLADNTGLLPSVANTFYYIERMNTYNVSLAGTPSLRITSNSGQGSAGSPLSMGWSTVTHMDKVECDSLLYGVSTHSSGSFILAGTVFKITYA